MHLNDFQLHECGYLQRLCKSVKVQGSEMKSKYLPTFTEGLCAGPGPIREAHPL